MPNRSLPDLINQARAEKDSDLTNQLRTAHRAAGEVIAAEARRAAELPNIVDDLLARAIRASEYRIRTTADPYGEGQYIKQTPGAAVNLLAHAVSLPALFDADGSLSRTPSATTSGRRTTLDHAATLNSRVAQAGANVILYRAAERAIAIGNGATDVAYEKRPSQFRLVSAAPFNRYTLESSTNDTNAADVADTALPDFIKAAPIDFEESAVVNKSFAVSIPRSARREIGAENLAAEISTAIALGLARAADEVLLSALTDAGLPDFSLAAAAAADLRFSDMRGIIGTTAAGAGINNTGELTAAGVAAQLSPDCAGTFIGAWDRTAVAIHSDISMTAKKLDRSGKIELVVQAAFLPLVPASGCMFEVRA